MQSAQDDGGAPELETGTAAVLQAATRILAGVALRSLDVLDSVVTLPQFRLLAVLADLGPVPSGRAARALGLDPSTVTRWPTGWSPPGTWPAAPTHGTAAWSPST